jgi:transcription initiation factor TFIIH subunit 4
MDPTDETNDTFYPTHLATSLLSGEIAAASVIHADEKRFLILETNYKIYAYTCKLIPACWRSTYIAPLANELEIAILNLFTDIRVRYKNLVVGKLDRKHVKRAMEKGINAYQVQCYPVFPMRILADSDRSSRICRVMPIRKCTAR